MSAPKRAWTPAPAPKGFPPPVGPYTPAVRAGNFVFVSGQTPRDPTTGDVGHPEIAVQARRTLYNLKSVLAAAGATLDDVVSVTVYLSDEDNWAAFNEIYKEFFKEPYPTRTAVGCQLRGILVEVSAIAMVADSTPAPGGAGKGFRPDMTLY
ncbi:MAG: RidA family protein [Gemmatimonadetes bacterium]|nr:RidA family protein [Gemmatimonadota bacterium]